MNDIERKEISDILKVIVKEGLDSMTMVDGLSHKKHHDFINELSKFDVEAIAELITWAGEKIKTEKRRQVFFHNAAIAATQWSVVGILGAIAYYIKSHFGLHR